MPSILNATVLVLAAVTASGPRLAAQQGRDTSRADLVRALQTLIATGPTGHATHDEGEWLQLAVTDAITRRDAAVERLAVRAASPLRARIVSPVSGSDSAAHIEIDAQKVLTVPRPVPYVARIFASLDGAEFVRVADVQSGTTDHVRVTEALGPAARMPGFHTVQMHARLGFSRTDDSTPWTESRKLPPLFYAVYDGKPSAASIEVRALLEGPGSVSAHHFDPDLDDVPFNQWLVNTLAARGGNHDNAGAMWRSQYCSERTGETGLIPDVTAVCAVLDVQLGGNRGQIWFRTADIVVNSGVAVWRRTTPPRFEGFMLAGSAPESSRLSHLLALLDTDPEARPAGDLSVGPGDILIAPSSPRPGEPALVTITIRNQGAGDVLKALVQVIVATSVNEAATRAFVVDVPARGTTAVKLQASFPQGYGVVSAVAMQETQHSPFESSTSDPTPEDACAYRVVNPQLTPAGFLQSFFPFGSGCRGK
jgi:hypothetical protein